ncbi:glycoside hydrolase family 38 C-terminal domain-containing protein [Acidobacteriota bacterium]
MRINNKKRVFYPILLFFLIIGSILTALSCSPKNQSFSTAERLLYFGFDKEITGETIPYHSPIPEAKTALLVRSIDKNRLIEWTTEPLPERTSGDSITFVWLAGIDVNTDSHGYDFFINDKKWFTFSNPTDKKNRLWQLKGEQGVNLEYHITSVDKNDDFMGYMFLRVPKSLFPSGQPLHLRVQGESAKSRSWFMIFKFHVKPQLRLYSEQAVLRSPKKSTQTIRAEVVHLGAPVQSTVTAGNQILDTPLELGHNVFRIGIPAVRRSKSFSVQVDIPENKSLVEEILINPVKHKDIYLLHHSHVDIGYTHIQEDVKHIQTQNIELAIDLASQTQDYPKESQFKWNTEVMWPVDVFKDYASQKSQDNLIVAIKKGWIGLDALYANVLTGLCRPEELMQLLESARTASQEYGVNVDAAMITDIPGYTWGLVPALAQSGVKYLSVGTNSGHRIGHVLSEWADRPFYWMSPSEEEKILCWVHGKGYSWFHTGLGYKKLDKRLQETPIFMYLSELETTSYPYDIIAIRYNIGSDNGPPDPQLSQTVKEWNEKYISPKMIIATTSEMFHAFENKYGEKLPVYKGDFTGCWEDGAASSARETALTRQAAERLVQAEVLWTIRSPHSFPSGLVEDTWKNILLFDEHTWGSWNSISDPDSDFTLEQWKTKQSFALEADRLSKQLMEDISGLNVRFSKKIKSLDIFNTTSWTRTDIVKIPADVSLEGDRVLDDHGTPLPSQRLSTGELVILLEDVPSFGAKRVFFHDQAPYSWGQATTRGSLLQNEYLSIQIDETSGTIKSLTTLDSDINLVNRQDGPGLNDYLYVDGRDPINLLRDKNVSLRINDHGPLVASITIVSEAPGNNSLEREIRIFSGLKRVDILNHLDKIDIRKPEGVHFAFPFFVPEGQVRLDIAWGFFRPEHDQLPGSNKNYFSIQRWADISNNNSGITWISLDAPLIEVGDIASDPIVVGWKKSVDSTQTIYSYVMNNYWETNYKASQEGPVTFHYSMVPHAEFNPVEAERFAIERTQPLIVLAAGTTGPSPSFLQLDSSNVLVTLIKPSKDGQAILLRLYNPGESTESARLVWGKQKPESLYKSSPFEEKGQEIRETLSIPAFGIITLRAENFK